jgi:RNA polymerase sigma factor (sigma-70 family)
MRPLVDYLRRHASDAPDRELVRRFAATRDAEAFGELVRRHGPVVFGVCRRMLANPHGAEDASQATFLVLVRRAGQLTDREALGPWLFQVAVWTARNVRRGNRRRAAVELEQDVPAREPRKPPGVDLDPARLALPPKYRPPLILCYLQGLSRREAAARLGCPEGTLSALLSRALKKLRDRLGVAPRRS